MATFGDLQTKASARLKDADNTAVSAPIVASVVNDAIEYWAKKRFWFNEFQETIALVQNDPKLPALSTPNLYLLKNDGIVIDYANTRWPVRQISPAEYDSVNVQGRGIPYAFCQRNNGYELYWYPDADYSAIVRGVKDYARFAEDGSANTQTNDFTDEAADLILYETLSRLFGEFRQDPKMETYYTNRAKNEYWNLQRQTQRMKSTGRIQVRGF